MQRAPLFSDWGLRLDGAGDALVAIRPAEVLGQVREHGAVLLTGFDVDLERFVAFSDAFSPRFVGHGHSRYREAVGSGQDRTTVGALVGQDRVRLHREMAYAPFAPDVLFFYCVAPAPVGGETTVIPAKKFFDGLAPAHQDLFLGKRLKFTFSWKPPTWKAYLGNMSAPEALERTRALQGIVRASLGTENAIEGEYVVSAILPDRSGNRNLFSNAFLSIQDYGPGITTECSFEDGSLIDEALIREVDDVGEQLTSLVRWNAGDVIVIDNALVAHGRRPFEGSRKLITRFCTI
jgi:hypothetical protein